eukprot:scaffold99190_cov42-Attheya_sp.AAC.5
MSHTDHSQQLTWNHPSRWGRIQITSHIRISPSGNGPRWHQSTTQMEPPKQMGTDPNNISHQDLPPQGMDPNDIN